MTENNGFLEMISDFNPLLLLAVGAVIIAATVMRIRNGELPGPVNPMDIFDDGDSFDDVDPLADYNPDDKWNTGPARSDRLDGGRG